MRDRLSALAAGAGCGNCREGEVTATSTSRVEGLFAATRMLRVTVNVVMAGLLMTALPYFIMWGIWQRVVFILVGLVLAIAIDLFWRKAGSNIVGQIYLISVFLLSLYILGSTVYGPTNPEPPRSESFVPDAR
jgi:predicted neutral ceramidase superfamily lipid hydrolase